MQQTSQGYVRWVLVAWMFVLSAIAYLDRVNISIAGGSLAESFHLSNVQLGGVFSAFLIGYAIFQVPGGRLADRWGARAVLTIGVVWWCVFTALTASIPSGISGGLAALIAVRFLLGVGEAVIYPSTNRMIASWIPISERGIPNGEIFAGVGSGAAVTPPLITWIMITYGWRVSFWFSAGIGAVAGLVWFVVARNTPDEHPRVSRSEAAYIAEGIAGQPKKTSIPWKRMLSDRNVLALTTSYFCYGYSAYIFLSWFFLYLVQVRGVNLRPSAYYSMAPFLALAIAAPAGGVVCDQMTRRFGQRAGRSSIAIVGMLLAAIFLAIGPQVASPRLATIVLAGGAGSLYLAQSSFWAATADIGGASAGSVSGVMNMGSQIGGALTASLTPAIAVAAGWTASFIVAAALCVLGGAAWLLVRPERTLTA